MSKLITFITDSQTKVFHDTDIATSLTRASVLSNEPYSLTYGYSAERGDCIPFSVSAECEGLSLAVYKVASVPVTHSAWRSKGDGTGRDGEPDGGYTEVATEGRGIDLYPDVMLPRVNPPVIVRIQGDPKLPFMEVGEKNRLEAHDEATASLIITANEERRTLAAGNYDIRIVATSLVTGETLAEDHFTLTVIGKELPKPNFKYTNWFHYDCIADIHGVELFSDAYFKLLESYFKNAADYGMNTLIIPAITPALDTPIGMYRQKAQLVRITRTKDGYDFDFSELSRLMQLALDCGIEYFEHPHLFTQWGAEHAPAIYAEVMGEEHRIFGWDTDASSAEYREFLESYIPAFRAFADELGVADRMFYHISDEPVLSMLESYSRAVDIVKPLLEGAESGDALSKIEFCEQGLVGVPIVSIDNAKDFYEKCDSFWTYYTGGYYNNHTTEHCTNRLITSKPYRARILGLHSYAYRTSGFLHWGHNYYYGKMSQGLYNPLLEPCAYVERPGAAYIVYPGTNCALASLREIYMREAMCDLAALYLLESLTDRDYVMALATEYFGEEPTCYTMPTSPGQMRDFRELINRKISEHV